MERLRGITAVADRTIANLTNGYFAIPFGIRNSEFGLRNLITKTRNDTKLSRTFVYFVMIFLFTPSVFCEEQIPVGVRAIGMGSAFVPVADDAAAISGIPAVVSRLGQYNINLMRAKLFDDGMINYLSGIVPASEKLALGVDWTIRGI